MARTKRMTKTRTAARRAPRATRTSESEGTGLRDIVVVLGISLGIVGLIVGGGAVYVSSLV